MKAIISDHNFASLDSQTRILEAAGFELVEIQPVCKTEDDVLFQCREADALLVQRAPVTRRVLKGLPRLKGIVRYGIGVDRIDLDAARECEVGVANIPTYCLEEVSNHAVAMVLALARRIPQDHYRIAHGGFGIDAELPPALTAMTLGLIGFGAIAQRVAQKARAFGFRIMATDPHLSDSIFTREGVERVDLETLLAFADVISLHCPLLPATKHLINRENIRKMKRGALIVNTSRGPVIQEPDLIEALTNGQVLGAGLDVFEQEPLPIDSPLRRMPNVLLTSHAASYSKQSVEMLQIKAAEAARDFLAGRRPESQLV
jgi:D-3-phosphoglycerate dehydrogenase